MVRRRLHLPHWDTAHGIYAVTFNLADAVPGPLIARLRNEIDALRMERIARFGGLTPADQRLLAVRRQRELVKLLDQGHGTCALRDPRVAEVVTGALIHFDEARYRLYAWCVMPNHVHVLMSLLGGHVLESVLHSWKTFTARTANRLLGRRGPFWQDDYFDRTVRNPDELRRWVDYIANNPARAGLKDWPHVKIYSERLAEI